MKHWIQAARLRTLPLSVSGIIVDLYAKEGAEYLKLNDGTVIRLDRLVSINGVPVSNIC